MDRTESSESKEAPARERTLLITFEKTWQTPHEELNSQVGPQTLLRGDVSTVVPIPNLCPYYKYDA